MAPRLLVTLGLISILAPAAPADARARCGAYTTREMQTEVDTSSQVFIGELIGAATEAAAIPDGHRGLADVTLQFRVTRVHKGSLSVGDTISVTWQGFSEAPSDPIAGGCSVPGQRPDARYPESWMVLASGADGSLTVPNGTSSRRVHENSQSFIRRITRMARRTR